MDSTAQIPFDLSNDASPLSSGPSDSNSQAPRTASPPGPSLTGPTVSETLESSSSSDSDEESDEESVSARNKMWQSRNYVLLRRKLFFRTLHGVGHREKTYPTYESHSYGKDNLILSTLCITMDVLPHNLAIAVYPQDTLHAQPETKSRVGDQIPDFKVLGWLMGENASHSKSSYLFFVYEKKINAPGNWPSSRLNSTQEWATNIEQLGSQAALAFKQYDVKSVYVVVAVSTYFTVLKYELPLDITAEGLENLLWHQVEPTPLCAYMPIMKDSENFSDGFLWALRMMTKVNASGPGGAFSINFQPSWFDPTSEADFYLTGKQLVDEKEAIRTAIQVEKETEEQTVTSAEDTDEDLQASKPVTKKQMQGLSSPDVRSKYPDATWQPRGGRRKEDRKGKGKEGEGEGEGKRARPSDDDDVVDVDVDKELPTFPSRHPKRSRVTSD